ncbi:GNAT family N-acetyltransferase [Segeticoccus sp.]|uniref:GNAT family N-acetyltransferase n=1 Tax=Segeticoccus sp. TaxID=2706531 RepID=UPI002D7F034E|nr:GNAT family N-acetyltransferase [Segeticoccus sp.]
MRIRRAEPADALAVAALHLQLGREQGHAAEPGFLDRHARAWQAQAPHRRTWLAVQNDGKPVGVLVAAVVDQLPRLGCPEGSWWHVSSLFVTPDARTRGLGERLLRTALQAARQEQVERVALHAVPEAAALYERVGFAPATARWLEVCP